MKTIKVTTPFKFAVNGTDVVQYDAGVHDVSERCAEVAVAEKWAVVVKKKPDKKEEAKGDK
jgi:hypothetical protein